MPATEHAPRNRLNVLEYRHGLTDILECGAGGCEERLRVIPPHPERELITLAKNALRHGQCFANQRLGFFEAL